MRWTRAAFLGSIITAGCAAASSPVRSLRIVAIGDSLALGVGAESPEEGFVPKAVTRLRERGVPVELTCVAMLGATVSDVARLQVPLIDRADIVIVSSGSNDLKLVREPADVASDAEGLFRAIRRRLPRAACLSCLVPIGFFDGKPGDVATRPFSVELATEYNRALVAAAKMYGAHVVEFRRGGGLMVSADGFHPSSRGYAAMALDLSQTLDPIASRFFANARRS